MIILLKSSLASHDKNERALTKNTHQEVLKNNPCIHVRCLFEVHLFLTLGGTNSWVAS